jgi:hypothetical protein
MNYYDETNGDEDGNGFYDEAESATPAGDIRHGVTQIARDAVTLAELQAQLLQVDLRNWLTATLTPTVVLAVVAATAALASLPVLLFSVAHYLVDATDLSLASSLLIAAGIGLLTAAICGFLAYRTLTRSSGAFTRFRTELARNLQWLKQVLSRPAETADRLAPMHTSAARRPPR